jgi:hypothetical protein
LPNQQRNRDRGIEARLEGSCLLGATELGIRHRDAVQRLLFEPVRRRDGGVRTIEQFKT